MSRCFQCLSRHRIFGVSVVHLAVDGRINAVMDELPNKATNERVDNLRGVMGRG